MRLLPDGPYWPIKLKWRWSERNYRRRYGCWTHGCLDGSWVLHLGPVKVLFGLLLFLLTSPVWGQVNVQSDLIDAPEKVDAGRTFVVKLSGDYPYTMTPEGTTFIELLDRQGNVVLLVTAASKTITISVNQQVIHPTDDEIKTAPWDDRDKFAKWLADNSTDQIFSDSHTVQVGEPPPPKPPTPPEPVPPTDPQVRKVWEAARKHGLRAAECKSVSENIQAVVAQAVATSMTREEMTAAIKARNEPITKDSAAWDAWEKELPGLFIVADKLSAIAAYEKIAAGLEAVK